jgi:hypothetical protein
MSRLRKTVNNKLGKINGEKITQSKIIIIAEENIFEE